MLELTITTYCCFQDKLHVKLTYPVLAVEDSFRQANCSSIYSTEILVRILIVLSRFLSLLRSEVQGLSDKASFDLKRVLVLSGTTN